MKAAGGVMTRADLKRAGHGDRTIRRLLAQGVIVKPRHGVYRLQGAELFGEAAFVEACNISPRGIICLVSALSHHLLITQIQTAVDLAVPLGNGNVASRDLEIRYIRLSAKLLQRDFLLINAASGGFYRIFTRERSVCDAFRYRKRIGVDVAYEALGALLRSPFDRERLIEIAHLVGVADFVLPAVFALDT